MTYKILLPQEIMAEGREYLESRGYQLINGSGMKKISFATSSIATVLSSALQKCPTAYLKRLKS